MWRRDSISCKNITYLACINLLNKTSEVTNQQNINYPLIAKSIEYIQQNPSKSLLGCELAEKLGVSSSQLESVFKEWSGVGLQKFTQFISVDRMRRLLYDSTPTLFDSMTEQTVSKRREQHESFVSIEEMTSEELMNGGESLSISYSYQSTLFDDVLIASTDKGICYLSFFNKKEYAFNELLKRFPNSKFILQEDRSQKNALECFTKNGTPSFPIVLHLKGTEFQFSVWRQLLKITFGSLTTYGVISEEIEKPKASRAVGTAIGSNPVAYIIPCHRVVQSTGGLGGYMWGTTLKTALIGWEAAQLV